MNSCTQKNSQKFLRRLHWLPAKGNPSEEWLGVLFLKPHSRCESGRCRGGSLGDLLQFTWMWTQEQDSDKTDAHTNSQEGQEGWINTQLWGFSGHIQIYLFFYSIFTILGGCRGAQKSLKMTWGGLSVKNHPCQNFFLFFLAFSSWIKRDSTLDYKWTLSSTGLLPSLKLFIAHSICTYSLGSANPIESSFYGWAFFPFKHHLI